MLPAAFSLSRTTGVRFITPKAPCPAPHFKITIYTDFFTYFALVNDLGLIYFVFFAPQAVFDYFFFIFSHFVSLCDVIRYKQMVQNYWLAATTEAYIGVQVSLLIENRNPN